MSKIYIKNAVKRGFLLVLSALISLSAIAQSGLKTVDSLVTMGFENVCWAENDSERVYVVENVAYRLSGVGIGKAIDVIQNIGLPNGKSCRLIVLSNNVPKISLYCAKSADAQNKVSRADWNVSYDLGDSWELVKKEKRRNSSLYKIDLVIYPEFSFRNIKLSVPYDVVLNLSPAVEVSLWKGSKITAQMILPIVNDNFGYRYKYVRPGFVTLAQNFRLPYNTFVTASVGLFNNFRSGADLKITHFFKNERFAVEGRLSYTQYGEWGDFDENGKHIPFKYGHSNKWTLTGSLGASYYLPRYNTSFSLKAERYLAEEHGIRFDLIRHFRYCSIGFYGMKVFDDKSKNIKVGNHGINGGFRFVIALPPYRYKRKGYIPRVLPGADWGFSYNAGNEFKYGKGFKSQASDNIANDNSLNPYFIKSELLNF